MSVERKVASPDKAATYSRPTTSISKDVSASVSEKRLIGGPNDRGMASKGKRKALLEPYRNARQTKMSRKLEMTPELCPSFLGGCL
ncbi:hypothetical protein ACOSP7_022919 [Xanthoceras sorbifolium]